jgi:hypothetical protein
MQFLTLRTYVTAAIAFLLLTLPTSAGAIDSSQGDAGRPSRWVPNDTISQTANDEPWGNVAYWMRWTGPASMDALPDGGDGTYELGWKTTGFDNCDDDGDTFGRAGFPLAVDVQADWTEDNDDAVVWVTDLDILKEDQRDNPDRRYSAWWECQSDDFFSSSIPYMESQRGDWDVIADPITSISYATLRQVPPEQGDKGIPDQFQAENVQTNMTLPWTDEWNFETGRASWVEPHGDVFSERICGDAGQGSCYFFWRPDVQGSDSGWIKQDFQVETTSNKSGVWSRFELGNKTGFQFEGMFRCPSWSPGWKGVSGNCLVDVWLKTASGEWEGKAWEVPADDQWYYAISDTYGSQNSDVDINQWINNRGFPLDMDAIWVSSDL